jgi:hypothetical protein
MKSSLLTLLFLSSIAFGQTNIIANQSHHGNLDEAHLETDNFGLPAPMIDSIIYLGGTCIVEATSQMGSSIYYDTVCDHSLFLEYDFNLNEIREHYPRHIKFIGFENYQKLKDKKVKSRKNRRRLNGIPAVILLILSLFMGGKWIVKKS